MAWQDESVLSGVDSRHGDATQGALQGSRFRQQFVGKKASLKLPLSPREQSVLTLICCGLSNKHIARELGIAPETVKSHAKKILAKLQAKTRAEAVAQAARRNLIGGEHGGMDDESECRVFPDGSNFFRVRIP